MSTTSSHASSKRQVMKIEPCLANVQKTSYPVRVIGKLSYVNAEKNEFGVLVTLNNVDPELDVQSVDSHYTMPVEDDDASSNVSGRNDNPAIVLNPMACAYIGSAVIGACYALHLEEYDQVVRVRVLKKVQEDGKAREVEVMVLDYGKITKVLETRLMKLDKSFAQLQYETAFAIACRMPDENLLSAAPFPKLENFQFGNHVEVYILSDGEPCLAVLGSLTSGPHSIPRDLFAYQMEPMSCAAFKRMMTSSLPACYDMFRGWAPNFWMYPGAWTLVNVISAYDPSRIAVRDVFTSLRLHALQQSLFRSYKNDEFRDLMKVDPGRLSVGAPVVIYYRTINAFIRGNVVALFHDLSYCDVEAVDIPDLIIYNVPAAAAYYPSTLLLDIPPQVFYFNFVKCFSASDRALTSKRVVKLLPNNSVARLMHSSCGAVLETGKNINLNELIRKLHETLPNKDGIDEDCQSLFSRSGMSRSDSIAEL